MRAGLTEWLDEYGRAWEARDAEAAARLFSLDAVYQWGPFGRRLRGRPVIREAWAEATEQQDSVQFGYEVLAASAHGGLVRWWCSYDEPERRVRVKDEGIFRLAFDSDGLCTSLEEWWNETQEPRDSDTGSVPLTRRQVLFYDYVANAIEARAPHREAHIALFREWQEAGRILMGGALGDPPHGAAIVFSSDDPGYAEEFARIDPYVRNGVATSWRIEPWNVVS